MSNLCMLRLRFEMGFVKVDVKCNGFVLFCDLYVYNNVLLMLVYEFGIACEFRVNFSWVFELGFN